MKKVITIHRKKFRKIIASEKIQKTISDIAKKVNNDFKGKKPIFISVLNGSFMFTSDLLKKIKVECEVSFFKVTSYKGTKSSGKVNELIGVNENLKGRTVIILEDIIDSGNTVEGIIAKLQKHKPAAIKIVTLFFKPGAYTRKFKIDYVGMKIPNDFIVGYGLDYDGLGRNLEDVYTLT